MKNKSILGLYWTLVLVMFSILTGYAQEPTPTPPSPAVIQGTFNLDSANLMAMPDVFAQTNISAWQNQHSRTGSGVRIGVLDRGFEGILDFESRASIQTQVYPAHNKEDYHNNDATQHGTQVLETIHTIAPEATLFACRYISYSDFVLCVNWLVANMNVNIINHSGGVPAIGLDNWTDEVDFATSRGVLWINSAGNFGQGVIEDDFNDQSGSSTMLPNGYHEFRGTNRPESIDITPNFNTGTSPMGIVMLSWDNPNANLELVVEYKETPPNTNTLIPVQSEMTYQYAYVNMDYKFFIRIGGNPEAVGTRFMLYIEFVDVSVISRTSSSIIIPANSPNSLTVGALSNVRAIANYSSQGPAEFGGDDNRINVIKPDLVTFGAIIINGEEFIGTSASAAITTGTAALVWAELSSDSANPNLYLQVRQYLLSNVEPSSIQDPLVFGVGLLKLPVNLPTAPIQMQIPLPTQTTSPLDSVTLLVTNQTGANIRSGPGTAYDTLYTVAQNVSLEATHYTSRNNGWFKINYLGNLNAWVSRTVVSYPDEAPLLPVPTNIPPAPIVTSTPVNPPVPIPTVQPNPPVPNPPAPVPTILNVFPTGDRMVCGATNNYFYLNVNISNPSSMLIAIDTTYGGVDYPASTSQSSGVFPHPQPFLCILTSPNGQCTLEYRITLADGSGVVLTQGTLVWAEVQTPCP